MDLFTADNLRTGISALSAVVAVAGAVSAARSRSQSRRDAFTTSQHELLISMASNDARADSLIRRAKLLEDELVDLLEAKRELQDPRVLQLFRDLKQLREDAIWIRDKRPYPERIVSSLPYTEADLASLRDATTAERKIAVVLAREDYSTVFEAISDFLGKHGKPLQRYVDPLWG